MHLARRLALALLAAFAAASMAAPVDVRFEVDLGAEIAAGRFDPAYDAVGLRGGWAPLAWSRSLPLAPLGSGRWGATVRFETQPWGGQPVPHKFRIERPGRGADEGWEPGANHAAFIGGPAPGIVRPFGAEAPALPQRFTGTVLQLDPVPSRHVAPRPVWVWLPPGYEAEPARRYPVLYLQDGQNVFGSAGAGAEWQVDEAAQRGVLAGELEPMIVVAIPSGRERLHELTPSAGLMDGARRGTGGPAERVGGGGSAYARFLLDELKPRVDARFRTKPESASTAVGGSSLGGLFSLWLALHEPGRVGAALVVSPSVWWDEAFALREARAWVQPAGAARPRLWLDIGTEEGEGAVEAVRALRDALLSRGWRGPALAYTEAEGARHDELAWAERVPGMLKFLHGRAAGAPPPKPQERAP